MMIKRRKKENETFAERDDACTKGRHSERPANALSVGRQVGNQEI
jgi:hypothetical protein